QNSAELQANLGTVLYIHSCFFFINIDTKHGILTLATVFNPPEMTAQGFHHGSKHRLQSCRSICHLFCCLTLGPTNKKWAYGPPCFSSSFFKSASTSLLLPLVHLI